MQASKYDRSSKMHVTSWCIEQSQILGNRSWNFPSGIEEMATTASADAGRFLCLMDIGDEGLVLEIGFDNRYARLISFDS